MSGSLRENVGKKDAKKLRKNGLVPANIYGGANQFLISIEEKHLQKVVFTPEVYLIELDINGTKRQTIIQEVQFHPVTDRILHVDFLEVLPGKPITLKIPIKITGNSIGVLKGGKLQKKFRLLKVKGLASDIPDHITLDVSDLDINHSIKVNDLKYEKLTFLDPASAIVVAVIPTRAVKEGTPQA
ncbi:MAG: 50S ribosomal protein L25 [Bacteroidetes bacterium ADurb.Bin012]|nr:MAG: 50S ribosomal protein L25 [Bacteroidetes bacterium ADurb.Bin012]